MSVTKLNAQGNPDPATEVVFQGSTDGNNWSFNTINGKWDPKTGTTGAFGGFANGLYRITVKAKVDLVTMQTPAPKVEKRDALLYTESFYVP
jgi:hypothetical protein